MGDQAVPVLPRLPMTPQRRPEGFVTALASAILVTSHGMYRFSVSSGHAALLIAHPRTTISFWHSTVNHLFG